MNVLTYILDGHTVVPEPDENKWMEWRVRVDDSDGRRVARDVVGTAEVSTVFLGITTSLLGQAPLVFETAVLTASEVSVERRYATWEEAEKGHKEVVRGLDPAVKSD